MKKLVFAFVVSLPLLGGCAQLQKVQDFFQLATGDVVPPQKALVAIGAFDAIEVVGTRYIRLPVCPTSPVCRTPTITAQVITWLKGGRADRDTLKAAIRANPGQNLSLVSIYQDLGNTTANIVQVIGPMAATLSVK